MNSFSENCKNIDRIIMCTQMLSETNSADLTRLKFNRVLTHAKGGNRESEFEREQCAGFLNVYSCISVSVMFHL